LVLLYIKDHFIAIERERLGPFIAIT
jgi:hypothetical protein